jgi:uncharacterized RDD family membrane protein YckC
MKIETATVDALLKPRYASVMQRVSAFAIDVLVSMAFIAMVSPVFSLTGQSGIFGVILVAYWLLKDTGGQSVGKKIVGIRVVTVDNKPCGLIKSVIRNLFLLPFVSLIMIVVEIYIWESHYRRIGDFAANTAVVTTKLYSSDHPEAGANG